MGLGIYCKECRIPFRGVHDTVCVYFSDSLYVEVEHCGQPIVWEPQSEVEDSPADLVPLELHLSDHLHLEDKV